MRTGFSVKVKFDSNEQDKCVATVDYNDVDDNKFSATAEGKNIEEVCYNLYDKLVQQIEALEEKSPEDMTDEEYITYLEDKITKLLAENESLKQPVQKKKEEKKSNSYKNIEKFYKDELREINRMLKENSFLDWL